MFCCPLCYISFTSIWRLSSSVVCLLFCKIQFWSAINFQVRVNENCEPWTVEWHTEKLQKYMFGLQISWKNRCWKIDKQVESVGQLSTTSLRISTMVRLLTAYDVRQPWHVHQSINNRDRQPESVVVRCDQRTFATVNVESSTARHVLRIWRRVFDLAAFATDLRQSVIWLLWNHSVITTGGSK